MAEDSRSVDALLAEAMGWTWQTSVDSAPSWLVPPNAPPREWRIPDDGTKRRAMGAVPPYSSSPLAFALVEQAIHDRGLGPKYVLALDGLLSGDGPATNVYFDEEMIWEMMRADLRTKAAAAFSVLQSAGSVPPRETNP
jgi:hypothetical protein